MERGTGSELVVTYEKMSKSKHNGIDPKVRLVLQRGDKREGMGEVARGGICVDRACALEFMNKNTDR